MKQNWLNLFFPSLKISDIYLLSTGAQPAYFRMHQEEIRKDQWSTWGTPKESKASPQSYDRIVVELFYFKELIFPV